LCIWRCPLINEVDVEDLRAYGFEQSLPAAMRVNLELLMPLTAQYTAPAWATIVAGFFVLLALSLSMYLIFDHLSAYNNPEVSAFLSAASRHQFSN
jgi:hypothetical protein